MTKQSTLNTLWEAVRRALGGAGEPEENRPVREFPTMEAYPAASEADPTLPPSAAEKAARARWKKGMPICLIEFYEPMLEDLDTLDFTSMRLTLLEEYPNPSQQALALFGWYGQGAGSWLDYPSYETVPEQLLMEIPLPILVEALEENPLEKAHLEGAARFFSGELFQGMRGHESAAIPAGIKAALYEHVEDGGDGEKLAQMNLWRNA